MDIDNKIQYWLDMAVYDMDTAGAMLETGRYLYVGFLCHQCIEKAFKAYYWHTVQHEPLYTHNLLVLADKSDINQYLNENMQNLLNRLMPLNIQARYPQNREALLQTLTREVCDALLRETKELFQWIKQLLKK